MPKRVHIMHVLPSLDIGGMENGTVNLANNLDSARFKTTICCVLHSGPMQDRIANGRSKVVTLGQAAGLAYTLCYKLVKLMQKEKVEILHTHNYYTALYGIPAARLSRVPVIHGVHGFESNINSWSYMKKLKNKLTFQMANHITCVSDSLGETVCDQFGIEKTKVTAISNGVDFQKFSAGHTRSSVLRRNLGLSDDHVIIGSVGRLHEQKNYGLLIRAFALLKKGHTIKLLLVGDGQEKERLWSLSKKLDVEKDVIFAGERDDIPEMLSVMDIFVLPSLLEGMCNTILEAMCAGLPVVASNVGGNPELVRDGKTGFLFKSDKLNELVDKLDTLLRSTSLRGSMGEYAQRLATDSFSIPAMVRKYEELYLYYSSGGGFFQPVLGGKKELRSE